MKFAVLFLIACTARDSVVGGACAKGYVQCGLTCVPGSTCGDGGPVDGSADVDFSKVNPSNLGGWPSL